MRAILVPLAALVCTVASVARAQVVLRAHLTQGDTLKYDFKAAFTVAPGDGRDPDRLEQEGRIRLTVAEIDRDGNATVRMAFETLKARARRAGVDSVYDPTANPAEAGDSPFAKIYAELAMCILEARVTPEGEVEQVGGMETAVHAAGASGLASADRALGAFSPEAISATIAPIFALDESGKPRDPGASWTVARKIPLTDPYTALVEARYTLGAVKNGAADLRGTIVTSLSARTPPDAGPTLEITDQSGTLAATWDVKNSRLVSRTAEHRTTWKTSLALKKPMATTRTTTSRLELKQAE